MNTRPYRIISIALAGALSASPLAAQTMGEEWEYQGNMDMMGMQMPIPVTRSCEEPQEEMSPPMDGNCEVSNIEKNGNTTNFTVVCTEPERMEGSGSMTRTDETFESNYTIMTGQGDMSFMITGKKLGSCTL